MEFVSKSVISHCWITDNINSGPWLSYLQATCIHVQAWTRVSECCNTCKRCHNFLTHFVFFWGGRGQEGGILRVQGAGSLCGKWWEPVEISRDLPAESVLYVPEFCFSGTKPPYEHFGNANWTPSHNKPTKKVFETNISSVLIGILWYCTQRIYFERSWGVSSTQYWLNWIESILFFLSVKLAL